MAFAAMRQRLGEIGAAIPFRAFRRIGLEARIRIEHRRPEAHRPALVERERQRVGGRCRAHRRQAEQIGFDRQRVRIRNVSVGRIRHRRIKPRAVAPDAAMHGVEEILIAVIADAGFLVGRDVGGIKRAERQLEAESAGIFLAARRGVADHAVRRLRQIFATLDNACLRQRGRHTGRIGAAIIRQRHIRAGAERHRAGAADNPDPYDQYYHHDGGDAEQNATRGRAHAFFPAISARSIGSRRNATPVAAKMALRKAGGPPLQPASPMPPGGSPLLTT